MERYKFLIDWQDPLNPIKVFKAGSVVRSFGAEIMAGLIADGVVMQVADYTRCVQNPLEAANACQPLTDEMIEAYIAETPAETKLSNKKNK
jgi:hypothetical protein